MRLVEENIYKILPNRDIDEDFLNGIPIRQEIILRVAKWDCMKLRHFCTENNTITIQEVACRMCVCVVGGMLWCQQHIKQLLLSCVCKILQRQHQTPQHRQSVNKRMS